MADSVVHLILLGKELHGKDIYLVVDSLLLLLFVYALIYSEHFWINLFNAQIKSQWMMLF